MANQSAEVIIIGAGVAGISAANKLFKSGYKNVKILEARDRCERVITQICLELSKYEFYLYSIDRSWCLVTFTKHTTEGTKLTLSK